MKKKAKILLLLSCALVLAVGAVVGVALRQQPTAPPEPEPTPRKIGQPGSVMIKVMQGVSEVNRNCGIPLGLTWEKAPQRTDKKLTALTFTGLDVDEEEGMVEVHLLMEVENPFATGHKMYPELDYFFEGEWYSVYSDYKRDILIGVVEPQYTWQHEPGTYEDTYLVPKKAFERQGQYRLSLIDDCTMDGSAIIAGGIPIVYGSCTFELILDL